MGLGDCFGFKEEMYFWEEVSGNFLENEIKISYGTIVELIEKCDFRILDGIDYFEFVN